MTKYKVTIGDRSRICFGEIDLQITIRELLKLGVEMEDIDVNPDVPFGIGVFRENL